MSDDEDIKLIAKCRILFSEIVDPTSEYNKNRKKYLADHGVNMLKGFVFTSDSADGSVTVFQKKEE